MNCPTCQAPMTEIALHLPDCDYSLGQCAAGHRGVWMREGRCVVFEEVLQAIAREAGGRLPRLTRYRRSPRCPQVKGSPLGSIRDAITAVDPARARAPSPIRRAPPGR